ncbi:MAG: DUF1499 domain-containing protein [Gemmatimonadota bacterium]|nr:DUF1499 domain-containing protein [Gemmatimonadota bacterium]MDH3367120.1 DUF1499 domain-containing protein [Gemmatimonadota bacterium]MDH3476708.1 DUF1499 domain-containing protein [Gemmatimonadota bacterium]MDH5549642.1 DUF1499 domain-containing protein [Gemmatimonadota bacterium]
MRGLVWLLAGVTTVVLAVGVAVVIQIDDWSRDLATNIAETRWDAGNPELRPLSVDDPLAALADLIVVEGSALPRWTLTGWQVTDSLIELRFVRTTRLFRFRDDITVRVADRGDRREVTAISASRVGHGDLGQNPRNLEELFRRLRSRLSGGPGRG